MATFSVTRISAANCDLTKIFSRVAGSLIKSATAHMTDGFAEVKHLSSVSDLRNFLNALDSHQAITTGIPDAGEVTPLTTRKGAAFNPNAVARTNETFSFPSGPALFVIDVDVDGDRNKFKTLGEAVDALERASPWLARVHRVARPSSSSFIEDAGLKGVHVFLAVTNGKDIKDLGERMKAEQWLKKDGYIKISQSGALLVRQISDALVYQPSRLFFECNPVLKDGVERNIPDGQAWLERTPDVYAKGERLLSTEGFLEVSKLPELKAIRKKEVTALIQQAKEAQLMNAKKISVAYHLEKAVAAGRSAEDGERFGLMANNALGSQKVGPTWTIHTQAHGRVTVADILANPDAFMGFCADPFDSLSDPDPRHLNKAEIVTLRGELGVWNHKTQSFFAFENDVKLDMVDPWQRAVEKLRGMIVYPDSPKKKATQMNIKTALRTLVTEVGEAPAFNVATGEFVKTKLPNASRLQDMLHELGCKDVAVKDIDTALHVCAMENEVDPWLEYVVSLPKWDGVERLHTAFEDAVYAQPEPVALRHVSAYFFSALVMRQLHPGIDASISPVLCGPQGVGKSHFAHSIAHAFGVVDASLVRFSQGNVEMSRSARAAPICEFGEMVGLSKKGIEDVKSWTTDNQDKYRELYKNDSVPHPRRFVTIGTANNYIANQDETGNRRFYPVHVTQRTNSAWFASFKQVLAEAKERYCTNVSDYKKLLRDTSDLVALYNKQAALRGEGIGENDFDAYLPAVLDRVLVDKRGRIVCSDLLETLRVAAGNKHFDPRLVTKWLKLKEGFSRTSPNGKPHYFVPEGWVTKRDVRLAAEAAEKNDGPNPFVKVVDINVKKA